MPFVVHLCSLSNFPRVSPIGSCRLSPEETQLKSVEMLFHVFKGRILLILDVDPSFDDLAGLEVELVVLQFNV